MNNRKIWCTYSKSSKMLAFYVCSFDERKTFMIKTRTNLNFIYSRLPTYGKILLSFTDIKSLKILTSNFYSDNFDTIGELPRHLKKVNIDHRDLVYTIQLYAHPFEIPSLVLKHIPRVLPNPTSARLELSKFFRSELYIKLLTFATYDEQ